MSKTSIRLLALTAGALCMSPAFAAKEDGAPAAPAKCTGLKVATGPAGKGYSKIFRDMRQACGAVVPMCEVNTSGGLDNLNAMSTKEADIGLAQIDTWTTMKPGDRNIAALQAVIGMHSNFMHVVTASNGYTVEGPRKLYGAMKGDPVQVVIQRVSQLKGKPVALVGSAQLLGRQVSQMMELNISPVDVDGPNADADAIKMVQNGQVAAAFTVSGWQHGALKNLNQTSGVTLVPFDLSLRDGTNYAVRQVNYKNLGVFNVNMLGVSNVLFTRPFQGEKAVEVSKLRDCLTDKLQEMRENDFEPAWNEVADLNNTFGVPRFAGVSTSGNASVPAAATATAVPAALGIQQRKK